MAEKDWHGSQPMNAGRAKRFFCRLWWTARRLKPALSSRKPGFARSRLERVIEASPDRVEPGCRYFQSCGGCHYQHVNYARQLAIKAVILRETLKRTAKIDLIDEIQIHPSPEWNYRNR